MKSIFDKMLRVCDKTFGDEITFIRNGEQFTARGTYNDNHEQITLGADGPAVDSTGPYLQCHKDLLPFAPRKGDIVEVNGNKYTVSRIEPDSEYGIDVFLHAIDDDDESEEDDD